MSPSISRCPLGTELPPPWRVTASCRIWELCAALELWRRGFPHRQRGRVPGVTLLRGGAGSVTPRAASRAKAQQLGEKPPSVGLMGEAWRRAPPGSMRCCCHGDSLKDPLPGKGCCSRDLPTGQLLLRRLPMGEKVGWNQPAVTLRDKPSRRPGVTFRLHLSNLRAELITLLLETGHFASLSL